MHTSFFTALAALATVATVVVGAIPYDCTRKTTVKAGDTCAKISVAQKVSTYQLMTVNKGIIDTACHLHVGEEICLGIRYQDCTDVHVVKNGENCVGICKAAGISLSTLYTNNQNLFRDCSFVLPGDVLCVSKHLYYSPDGIPPV
ncbi:uncharacterized protein EDB91DRAFT_1157129 [Suillus paluster]|uniref:uncharacterized protein n=1 Tax=Suillus paluster TaxID=48578 RepID=UPI001B886513|nr:uncharacterized protein EDB91DRAFT_1157129 [Suillus paluster]KAG1730379.1 hypothetical protein EDB91DRAFT_1157129 [Suillus paluster]